MVNEGTDYVSHFVWVPYADYPQHFHSALEVYDGGVEVDELRYRRILFFKESDTLPDH